MNIIYEDAFKSLQSLCEEDFNIGNLDGIEELDAFKDINDEKEEFLDVYDLDAVDEDQVKPSYIGNVILDCEICHSKMYKLPEDVEIDEETGMANIEERCPICNSMDGFTIIGQVSPYVPETAEQVVEEPSDVQVEIDGEEAEVEPVQESCSHEHRSSRHKKMAKIEEGLKIKEGYIGQSLSDFLDDWNNKEEVSIWCYAENEDEPVFEGEYEDIPDRYLGAQFDDFDTEGRIYVNISDVDDDMDESCKNNPRLKKDIKEEAEEEVCPQCGKSPCECEGEQLNEENNWDKIQKALKRMGVKEELDNDEEPAQEPIDECGQQELEESVSDCNNIENALEEEGIAESLEEDFKEASITTDTEKMEMSTNEDGGVTVTTTPINNDEEVFEDSVEEQPVEEVEQPEDEMLAPVDDETKEDIEAEEVPESEDDVVYDFEDFDEESFDEIGESYLKKVYENVDSYKTTEVGVDNQSGRIKVEGLIGFKSGNTKKTQFMFEADRADKDGNLSFFGENLQFTRGKKSFKLRGKLTEGKLSFDSLHYNYKAKVNENKSVRVYGTAKINEGK